MSKLHKVHTRIVINMASGDVLEDDWYLYDGLFAEAKSSPSPPPAPDPVATAQAQAAANKEAVFESARVSQINEISPFGSATFSGEIGEPSRTRTTTLPTIPQATLESQNRLAQVLSEFGEDFLPQITGALEQPFTLEGLPELPTGPNLNAAAQAVERATFERGRGLLDPGFRKQERRLNVDLVNRGLPRSGEAFRGEIKDFRTAENEALNRVALDAVRAGRSEQSRLFGVGLQERQQGIGERQLERAQPINELAALLQGAPAINVPQFAPPASFGVQPPDILGAQQLALGQQNLAFNAAQSRNAGFRSGLFGLGAAALPLIFSSHSTFKTDKRPAPAVLPLLDRLDIGKWRYRPEMGLGDDSHLGPYAEQFREVFGIGDGVNIHAVDALGICLKAIQELSARLAVVEAR